MSKEIGKVFYNYPIPSRRRGREQALLGLDGGVAAEQVGALLHQVFYRLQQLRYDPIILLEKVNVIYCYVG